MVVSILYLLHVLTTLSLWLRVCDTLQSLFARAQISALCITWCISSGAKYSRRRDIVQREEVNYSSQDNNNRDGYILFIICVSLAFLFSTRFSNRYLLQYGPSEEPEDVRGSANHIKDEMHMVLVNGYWRGLPEFWARFGLHYIANHAWSNLPDTFCANIGCNEKDGKEREAAAIDWPQHGLLDFQI